LSDSTLSDLCSRVRAFIREPKVAAEFETLALDIFRFQFAQNTPYRAFCERSGKTPASTHTWREIPVIVTSAFKDLCLTVVSAAERTTVFHSSGTTQQRPSRNFHSAATLHVYEESLLTWFRPHVLPDLDHAQFLILAPPAAAAPHSSLAHMFEAVSSKFGRDAPHFVANRSADGSWDLNFESIDQALHALRNKNMPVIICGTAFSFVHWCDHLAHSNLAFPPGSRVFETGGYKGRSRTVPKAELHSLIEEKLGIPQTHIVSEYGMSELSSQAYDRAAGHETARVFHFPSWARALVISPETRQEVADGETGLVRICDLANVGSVIVVQTEDLAVRRGDGFELIGRTPLAEPRGCSLLEVRS
jgi:hypothetical protein